MCRSHLTTFCALLIVGVTSQTIDIYDARVYNFYFYVNNNYQNINITTPEEAQQHWKNVGITQGIQACGSFHVLQFLDNYPDIKQKYGNNYTAAIGYYLQPNGGYDQQLMGFTANGSYGRYTLGNTSIINNGNSNNNIGGLYLSGDLRMGSAIDSLVWNNFEFINTHDHGRELQMAIHNDSGQCFNPTEAGSAYDSRRNSTTSVVINITVNNKYYESFVQAAFWDYNGDYDKSCGYAINKQNISDFIIHKKIILGYDYNLTLYNEILKQNGNVIGFNNSFYIPNTFKTKEIYFESPTAYLNHPFNTFYFLDIKNGTLTKKIINEGTAVDSNVSLPIIATNDSNYALGVLPLQYPPFEFRLFNFTGVNGGLVSSTSKWNILQYFDNVKPNSWINFENYLCVGNLNAVANCLMQISMDRNLKQLLESM